MASTYNIDWKKMQFDDNLPNEIAIFKRFNLKFLYTALALLVWTATAFYEIHSTRSELIVLMLEFFQLPILLFALAITSIFLFREIKNTWRYTIMTGHGTAYVKMTGDSIVLLGSVKLPWSSIAYIRTLRVSLLQTHLVLGFLADIESFLEPSKNLDILTEFNNEISAKYLIENDVELDSCRFLSIPLGSKGRLTLAIDEIISTAIKFWKSKIAGTNSGNGDLENNEKPEFADAIPRYTPKKSTKARGGLLLVFLSITVTFVGLLSFVSSFDQVERTLHAQNLGMISIFVGSVAATMACSAINKLFLHRCVPADKIAGLTMLWLGVTYTAFGLAFDLNCRFAARNYQIEKIEIADKIEWIEDASSKRHGRVIFHHYAVTAEIDGEHEKIDICEKIWSDISPTMKYAFIPVWHGYFGFRFVSKSSNCFESGY